MSINMAEFAVWRGRQAQEILDREQTHLVVRVATGEIILKELLVTRTWPCWAALPSYIPPPYGRVWVHVE